MTRLLITRPEEEAKATARGLEEAGFETLIHPALTIRAFPDALQNLSMTQADALIITSPQALKLWAQQGAKTDLPLFIVGERTAQRVEKFFPHARVLTAASAAELMLLILKEFPKPATFLYPRGREISFHFAAELGHGGHKVKEDIVYAAERGEAFDATLTGQFKAKEIDCVLHYSIRSARCFLEMAAQAGVEASLASISAVAMSPAVANALGQVVWKKMAVAPQPTDAGMMRALEDLYTPHSHTRDNA